MKFEKRVTGTTVKHTSPGRIKAFKFALPDSKLMQRFGEVAGNWHALIAHNCEESRQKSRQFVGIMPRFELKKKSRHESRHDVAIPSVFAGKQEIQITLKPMAFTESIVEDAALSWFDELGYPPDKQEKATQTVLQQAELLCADWAG